MGKEYYQKNREKILEYQKQYAQEHKEAIKKYKKQYRINNKINIAEGLRQYYYDNKEVISIKTKEYYLNNIKKLAEYNRQYYLENKDKIIKCTKLYYKENREKIRGNIKKYIRKRRRTDLKFNLNLKIGTMMRYSLRGNKNGRCWRNLVGYTLIDLKNRLNKTMPEGYTWDDYIKGELHIDHIIPIKVFNFTKPEHIDFQRCWALENLQLLPAQENRIKHARLSKPFQPALAIYAGKVC